MPIPSPKGDKKDVFISNCMGDKVMKKEFPDQKQRAAVCYSKWTRSKGELEVEVDFTSGEVRSWTKTSDESP